MTKTSFDSAATRPLRAHDRIAIDDVMKLINGRLSVLKEELGNMNNGRKQGLLSEQDAYLQADPVLAQLYKQKRAAQANLRQLQKEWGENDPMVEVAQYQVESALSQFETRLIELKRDEVLGAEVAQKIRAAKKAYLKKADKLAEEERKRQAMFMEAQQLKTARKKLKENKGMSWLVLWLIASLMSKRTETMRWFPKRESFSQNSLDITGNRVTESA